MFWLHATALIAIGLLYVIWRPKRYFSIWDGQGIPYLTFTDYLVHIYDIAFNPYKDAFAKIYKKYGPIFGSYLFSQPTLYISDPELIKQVMVKDFGSFQDRFAGMKTGHRLFDIMVVNLSGQEWKETRDIITPAFTSGKMRQIISTVEETSQFTVDNFVLAAQRKENILARDLFGAYSMDIIARIAFATKLNSHNDPNNEFVRNAKTAFAPSSSWRPNVALMFPRIARFFKITFIPDYIADFFENVIKKVIQNREENPQSASDLLQLLLNAKKEESLEKEKQGNKGSKQVLTMDSITAQCVLFFLAGYDSTGSVLSHIAYYLAVYPQVQEKLVEEIDKLDKNDGLTYESINSLHYLDAVINESFRMGGIPLGLPRLCTQDTELGGVKMKKGMLVMIPTGSMMHDPQFFSEPEKFMPERFLPENKDSIKPYTFFPFGEGPRHCLGMRLARMVMKVVIIKLLRRVRLTICSETPIPLEPLPRRLNIQYKRPITVAAVERI